MNIKEQNLILKGNFTRIRIILKMKEQWGCQGPGWVSMFMCEHLCSGCGLQEFFLLGECRASSELIQAWCMELWSFPETGVMHLPVRTFQGVGELGCVPHVWGHTGGFFALPSCRVLDFLFCVTQEEF